MSERRLKLMEIRELIRHIREGRSDRQIGNARGAAGRSCRMRSNLRAAIGHQKDRHFQKANGRFRKPAICNCLM
jgi:hypothetical protein